MDCQLLLEVTWKKWRRLKGKIVLKSVKGVASEIERLYFDTSSEITRKKYAGYMAFKTCDECHGKRFKEEVLANKINGKSIADVLDMDVNEALEFFDEYKEIHNILNVLKEVGLEYIKLGQSATTLSGGEAQRVKLAEELSRKTKGKTIYILNEPTNGLHFNDIKKLLNIFKKLIDDGNTIIVIEHNIDAINSADWIVDIGPEGGDNGGRLIAEGTLDGIKKCRDSFTAKYIR